MSDRSLAGEMMQSRLSRGSEVAVHRAMPWAHRMALGAVFEGSRRGKDTVGSDVVRGFSPGWNKEACLTWRFREARTVFRLRKRFSTVPIFSLHCNTADLPCGAIRLGQAVLRALRCERNRERKGGYSPSKPSRAPWNRRSDRAPFLVTGAEAPDCGGSPVS
jgi:hypothetical protein